eukprot:TRINITY_DN6931_c0_g1_i1.p2 TRINITY_DN6931_c0_g1~~TRINITY_DN6931_c0_g1_i1.p2  ORF type:complete len:136 (+),score=22.56 TRINITY_DN6931_c0_g1_i1:35-442(+)
MNLGFEEVFFDGLLELLFVEWGRMYEERRMNRFMFACGGVNKRWRKLYRHPLLIFARGEFDEILLRYPPTYYITHCVKEWKVLLKWDTMTKLIESVTDQDEIQERFILDNMFLNHFDWEIQSPNTNITKVLTNQS